MESPHQHVSAHGPAASLRRHKLAVTETASPPLDAVEHGKQSSDQQLDRFESQLKAITEKLDRCLEGIADNASNLKALRHDGPSGVTRLDPSVLGNLPLLESNPQQLPPSKRSSSPHGSAAAPTPFSKSTGHQKHPSEVASSYEPILPLEDEKRLMEEMRERRVHSGHATRTGVELSHSKSKSLTFLSDGVVSANHQNARRRNKFVVKLWRALDEPGSSPIAAWTNRIGATLIFASIMLTLVESGAEPTMGVENAIIQLCLDTIFSLELLVRLYCCPSRRVFLAEVFTIIDILACFPILVVRALFSLDWPLSVDSWQYLVLIAFTPVLRLLLMLRRFEQIHLQFSAFRSAAEAMPVLIYALSTLIVLFGALVFVVEPRDNIASFADALWMTMVTCYTVGYGDIYPVSPTGRCIVCALMFLSAMYMTIPIGIVGDAFSRAWAQKDDILLVKRMSTRLRFAHINAEHIPSLFHRFDEDKNGMINRVEFLHIIQSMRVNLDDSQALQLFNIIDADESGEITDEEFVKVLYPHDFKQMYSALSSVVDITKHVATSAINSTQEAVNLGSETAQRVRSSFRHVSIFGEEVSSQSRDSKSRRHSKDSQASVREEGGLV